MKVTPISKGGKKKWNVNSSSTPKILSSNRMQQTSHSFLQVDNSIHFVLDGNNFKYSTALPTEKNIELSRKTYSKKNPITFHPLLSPGRTDTFDSNFAPKAQVLAQASRLPSILKCPSETPKEKCTQKKLKLRNTSDITRNGSKKSLKKSNQLKTNGNMIKKEQNKSLGESSRSDSPVIVRPHKTSLKSFDKKLTKPPKKKPLPLNPEDEDSDIEILEVKLFPTPVPQIMKKECISINGKRKLIEEASNGMVAKKKCTPSHLPQSFMTNDVLINEADTAPFMPSNPNGYAEVRRSTNSMRWLTMNGSTCKEETRKVSSNYSKKISKPNSGELFESPQNKGKGKRELKSLFENLNEISWAHETSFKNMLCSPISARHEKRGKVMTAETRKKLRTHNKPKQTSKSKKPTSSVKVLALKKSRLAKLNQMKAKPIARNQIVPMMNKIRKQNIVFENQVSSDSSKARTSTRAKATQKITTKKVLALKPTVPNDKECKPDISKLKAILPKLKTTDLKVKSSITKVKATVPKLKLENPEPSTSGLNGTICNGKALPSNNKQFKIPKPPKFLKNFNGFQEQNTMEIVQTVEKKDIHSAVQKGSKLQVRLKPLEHTNYWTHNFYEDFRKNFLDQALHRAIESKDHDSIAVMFQELLNSVLSPPNANAGEKAAKKKKSEEEALRSSVRQSEGAFRYKEIVVKKHQNYIQVVLVPNEVKQNCLTIEAMKEIRDAFLLAKKDPNCKAVLLNSSGRYFCSGIDLSQIVGTNKKQIVEEMAATIQELVLTLCTFTKPVVAAVNGATYGFGVTLLTYCDVVLASDKATFCVPAIRLGYLPEGGITLTLPHVVGTVRANEILLQGRCLTAEEALRYGLVSELMWPTTLMNNVIPRLQKIISQPLQAMEATKSMIRCHLWDKLKSHVERERRLVRELWLGAHCQNNIKRLLQTGYLVD